jgi:membrane fusion protein, multidrug efflux system
MRKTWLIAGLAGVLVVGGAAAVLAGGALKKPEAAKDNAPPVALEFLRAEVVQPLNAVMPEEIVFSGPLMAPRTAVVRAKASGTLLSLVVAEGSRVQAGQVLGVIDVAELQTRVAERRAGVESAQARVAEAQRLYSSNEDLARQQFISANALESSKAALEAARAQLKSSEAQLETASLGLREARLNAPIGGVVGKRSVLPGEKVSAEQELLTVVDLSQLELGGVVGTHQVSRLEPGQPVAVRIEGEGEPVPGRIDRIAPAALSGTRGIQVVVAVANPKERLRAGQYASAVVSLTDATERLTLPLSALGQASGQDHVWTIEKGVLVRRIVITGRKQVAQGRVEITRGLPAGVPVLAARFDNLKEGAPARVVDKRGTAALSAAPVSLVQPDRAGTASTTGQR